MLEAAVRWVIILLVAVFDPLAIALVLAANASKEWDKEEPESTPVYVADVTMPEPEYEPDDGPLADEQIEQIKNSAMKFVDHGEHPKDRDDKVEEEPIIEEQLPEPDPVSKPESEKSILEHHPYLTQGFAHFKDLQPMVYKPEIEIKTKPIKKIPTPAMTVVKKAPKTKSSEQQTEPLSDVVDRPGDYLTEPIIDNSIIVTPDLPFEELPGGYVSYDGKHMSREALFGMHPNLKIAADQNKPVKADFGTKFPEIAEKGDVFTRVDVLPNKVYKFDGSNWIQVNKDNSNTYLYNSKYLDYIIDQISKGLFDPELLTDNERAQIEDHLKIQKNNQNT